MTIFRCVWTMFTCIIYYGNSSGCAPFSFERKFFLCYLTKAVRNLCSVFSYNYPSGKFMTIFCSKIQGILADNGTIRNFEIIFLPFRKSTTVCIKNYMTCNRWIMGIKNKIGCRHSSCPSELLLTIRVHIPSIKFIPCRCCRSRCVARIINQCRLIRYICNFAFRRAIIHKLYAIIISLIIEIYRSFFAW